MQFRRLPSAETRIQLVHRFPAHGAFELLQDQGGGAGVCVGDMDGDGRPDVFFTNYDQGNRLYRNLGNWRFEEIGEQAGVRATGKWCAGATAVDVDNDGDLDLAVAVFNAPNLMFINQGNGVFQDEAKARGLDFSGASVAFAFEDYDRDGWIDAHLVTHRLAVTSESRLPRSSKDSFARGVIQVGKGRKLEVNPDFQELFEIMSKGEGRSELIIAGQRDQLYHGNGKGGFEERAREAGIVGHEIGLASHWWDYNADGWPDLYVSNDYKGSDRLFENKRDGTFSDVAISALPCIPWSSMGSDSADINNDGLFDFLATDMSGSTHLRRMQIFVDEKESWFLRVATPKQYPRNALFLGTGASRLFEISQLAGVAGTDWTWSPKLGDFDNDGWVDLFVANGMARDFVNTDLLKRMKDRGNRNWLSTPVLKEPNLAFRNQGDLRFTPVAEAWGLSAPSASYGAAVADLDRDGDLDLVVMSFGEEPLVYRNDSPTGGRLLVRLKGTRSNAWGIGATIRIQTGRGQQVRRLTLASGFMSANEPLAQFGLGEETQAEKLTVEWPSGHTQSFANVAANQWLTITEPSESPPPAPEPPVRPSWFRHTSRLAHAQHREQDFDEFTREPLLPWALSRWGPGLACGDVNGDGREDVYLGGAAGSAGSLWIQDANHSFTELTCPAFHAASPSEDLGALFFDLDSDGDLDLYVVSGGVECADGEPVLADRLYINDGKGDFKLAPPTTLPPDVDSGSTVSAADFDRDGDVDLFVGGRSIPGRYPHAARNRLLRNERGTLADATDGLAPQLRETGMVTGSIWSDVDEDGWPDLLVTHEWGQVRLFSNRAGRLMEVPSASVGLGRTGWWTSIAGGDFDHDGDIDFVVGNLGLNTPYQATPTEPAVAFYGDFDGSGTPQWIEAYFEDHRLLPRRRWETLGPVIPSLLNRYADAASYARAPLAEWLTDSLARKGRRLEMNTLETGVLSNEGKGRFEFTALPILAQSAPCFGVAVRDFDADGNEDIILAQNFSASQPDIGALNGGMGLVLRGNGRGGFQPVSPRESGLLAAGDSRAMVTMDVNGDQRPDLLIAQNNASLLTLENQARSTNAALEISLSGRPGNPTGIGARLRVIRDKQSVQTVEVHAGDGYLSQSSPKVSLAGSLSASSSRLEVRWPRGTTNVYEIPGDARTFEAREPRE